MRTQKMTVTPEMASEWLDESNHGNRVLRKWHVNALAAAIVRGEWKLTHQGIAFGKSGKLLDGQHRLEAVIIADKPVEMNVTFGVPDDAFIALDQGVNRNYADLLRIDKRISEPLRLAVEILVGSGKVSPLQAQEIGECGLLDALERLIEKSGSSRKTFSSASFKLAAALRLMETPETGDAEYILAQYRALTICDADAMSKTSKAILRQSSQGHVDGKKSRGLFNATKKGEAFARAMTVFDPSRPDLTTIRLTSESCRIAYETARNILHKNMAQTQRKAAQNDPHRLRDRTAGSAGMARGGRVSGRSPENVAEDSGRACRVRP
jgi:hypothetical protein